jgi:hypothetical protein
LPAAQLKPESGYALVLIGYLPGIGMQWVRSMQWEARNREHALFIREMYQLFTHSNYWTFTVST